MGKIEVDQGMNRIAGMILAEEILKVARGCIKILEDIIEEGDIEKIIEMKIITEKVEEVDLEKDNQTIIEGETGVVVIVDQGQDQGQVQIEIEKGVICVENMITLQKIALQLKMRDR